MIFNVAVIYAAGHMGRGGSGVEWLDVLKIVGFLLGAGVVWALADYWSTK